MIKLGVMHGARYIILLEDSYCPEMNTLLTLIESIENEPGHEDPTYLYVGEWFWDENEKVYAHATSVS